MRAEASLPPDEEEPRTCSNRERPRMGYGSWLERVRAFNSEMPGAARGAPFERPVASIAALARAGYRRRVT